VLVLQPAGFQPLAGSFWLCGDLRYYVPVSLHAQAVAGLVFRHEAQHSASVCSCRGNFTACNRRSALSVVAAHGVLAEQLVSRVVKDECTVCAIVG
jgi:hypothetical protein